MGLLSGSSTTNTVTNTAPTGPSAALAQDFIAGAQGNQGGANAALAQLLAGGSLQDPALVALRDAITNQVNQQFFAPGGAFAQAQSAAQQSGNFSSSGRNNLLDRLMQTYTQTLGGALAEPQFNYQNAAQNRILAALGLQNQAALGGSGLYNQQLQASKTRESSPQLGNLLGAIGLGLGGLFGEGGLIPGLEGLFGGDAAAGGYDPGALAANGYDPNQYQDIWN